MQQRPSGRWELSVSCNRTDNDIDLCSCTVSKDNGEKLGRSTVPVSSSPIQSGLMCVWLWDSFCTLGCFPYCLIITLSVRHSAETPRECRIAPLDKTEKCSGRESANSFPIHRKMKFLYMHTACYPCSCSLSVFASVTLVMVISQHQ